MIVKAILNTDKEVEIYTTETFKVNPKIIDKHLLAKLRNNM